MKVTINGHEFNYSGSGSISVNGNNVVINGQTINGEFVEDKNIDIHVEGSVSNIETTGSVSINGSVNYVDAGGSVHCGESKSSRTNDRQYYEKVIKDAYESEKGLETVEEGIRFTDTLRTLFGIKPCSKKGSKRI